MERAASVMDERRYNKASLHINCMIKVRIEIPPCHDDVWLPVLKTGKSGVNATIKSTASVPPEPAARACFQRRTGIIKHYHASDVILMHNDYPELAGPTNNTNSETLFGKIIKIAM